MTHNRTNTRIQAFTVLEMLIAMVLLSIFLMLAQQFFLSSSTTTSNVAGQTSLQQEIRAAGSVIADEVQRAAYVFPPCGTYSSLPDSSGSVPDPAIDTTCTDADSTYGVKVSWSSFDLVKTGRTMLNPVTNTTAWSVGGPSVKFGTTTTTINSAPILAMIVAPRQPTLKCQSVDDATTAPNLDGCYQFVAYYPVLRSKLTVPVAAETVTGLDANADLEPTGNNDDRWVLLEYRQPLRRNLAIASGQTALTSWAEARSFANTVSFADRIPWGDAGCVAGSTVAAQQCALIGATATRYDPPNAFSAEYVQKGPFAIPALENGEKVASNISRYRVRMMATMRWLANNGTPGSGRVLLDFVKPTTGFTVKFNKTHIDERGVLLVRFGLQLELNQGGKTVQVPGGIPSEFTASPRNIQ
jgi:prepilin-type N-terminal cleavage/methylation domain-containing protein